MSFTLQLRSQYAVSTLHVAIFADNHVLQQHSSG